MDKWITIIESAIGTGGLFMFIFGIYTMKVKKKNLEADLAGKYADEWQKLYKEMKQYTDERVEQLERKVDRLEKRDEFRRFAIEQYRHCPHLPKGGECPVIKMNEQVQTSYTSVLMETDDLKNVNEQHKKQ